MATLFEKFMEDGLGEIAKAKRVETEDLNPFALTDADFVPLDEDPRAKLHKVLVEQFDARKAMSLDQCVGWANWQNALLNRNEPVGKVTNLFAPYNDLTARSKRFISLCDDKGCVEAKYAAEFAAFVKDANNVFFWAMGNNGKGKEVYVSPFAEYKDVLDVANKDVCNMVVKLAFARMRTMAMTPDNILKACLDMATIARMYQEGTIDAAKTSLNIIIERLKALKKVKVRSKDAKAPFELKLCFDKDAEAVEAKFNNEDSSPILNREGTKAVGYIVNDCLNQLRCRCLMKVKELAEELVLVHQTMDDETMALMKDIRERAAGDLKHAVEVTRLVKENYMSLSSSQRIDLDAVFKAGLGEYGIREQKKSLKYVYNPGFSALSNDLRVAMKDLSLDDKVGVCFYVAYTSKDAKVDMKEADDEISNFVSMLLEEEMFIWVLNKYRTDSNVPQETRDELDMVQGFMNGEVANFVLGRATEDGNVAVARDKSLAGKFTLRHHGKHWYACKDIRDLVVIPEPDDSMVSFVTSGFEDRDKLHKAIDLLMNKDVTLVPYSGGFHDAVVVDKQFVCKFRCNLGVRNGSGRIINEKGISSFYANKHGKVTTCIEMKYEVTGKDLHSRTFYFAFVVLTGTKVLKEAPIIENKAPMFADALESIAEAPAPDFTSGASGMSMFESLMAGIDDQAATTPVVEQPAAAAPTTSFFEDKMSSIGIDMGDDDF